MLKKLCRKPLFIAWAVLGVLFVFTLINLNLITPRTSLWQSNWLLVLLTPGFIILPLVLAFRDPIAPESPKNRVVKLALSIGKVVGWSLMIPIVIFLLVASGTKYAQLSIETPAGEYPVPNTEFDNSNLVDVRGEIHVHSSLSWDSKGKIEDIVLAAKKNDVRWIIFTDHIGHLPSGNYPDVLDGVTLIYGQERTHRIGGKPCGSALRASLKNPERDLQLYGHIEKYNDRDVGPYDRWDGIELVSFHANARSRLGSLFSRLIFNPREFYPTLTRPSAENLEHWQVRAEWEDRPIPIFAAPDAHQNMGILGCQTDPYEFIFKMVSTHVWIEKSEELNQESIFKAIKAGRTYIAFDYLGDPTGFQFWATDKSEKRYYTGAAAENVDTLRIELPRLCDSRSGVSIPTKIRVYRHNYLAVEFSHHIPGPNRLIEIQKPGFGFWRVEIEVGDRPWIISGQIQVK